MAVKMYGRVVECTECGSADLVRSKNLIYNQRAHIWVEYEAARCQDCGSVTAL